MPRYRVFEKNPITNEWIDRDWVEANGQDEATRKQNPGDFFFVPETSYHPVRVQTAEVVRTVVVSLNGDQIVSENALAAAAADASDEDD